RLVEEEGAAIVRGITDAEEAQPELIPQGSHIIAHDNFTSQSSADTTKQPIEWEGRTFRPGKGGWKTNAVGSGRLSKVHRFLAVGNTLRYRRRFVDFDAIPINDSWDEFRTSGFGDEKTYIVQTNRGIVERCLLMATDPGDLVLDPT